MKDAHFFRPRNKSLYGAQEGGEMNICFDVPTSCYSSVYLFGQFKMKILVVGPMVPLPRRAATEVASSTTKSPVHSRKNHEPIDRPTSTVSEYIGIQYDLAFQADCCVNEPDGRWQSCGH